MLLVYVDDILVAAPSDSYIEDVKQYVSHLFTIKDLGPVKYFLRIELARSSQSMLVTQNKYISYFVCDLGLERGKGASTPLPPGIKLSSEGGNLMADPSRYRRQVGRILYMSFTRPEASHAAQQLSQFLHHPYWAGCLDNTRDKFKSGFVLPTHVTAKGQIADVLTKPLSGPAFVSLRSKLNLVAFSPSSLCRGDVEIIGTSFASTASTSLRQSKEQSKHLLEIT
ncbi:UNVERIFIED_CONTAM: putative mitochondrial protein [Sesamum calycinum]|uniref:Mitochondrial protein n=1 Tax=Sesamum calycinum TaxID=2727403 RepID=A0AAW2SVV2_9LAMI